jgi:hypothetical protein
MKKAGTITTLLAVSSFLIIFGLGSILNQHNWAAIELFQFYASIIFVPCTIVSIIFNLINFKSQSKIITTLSFFPLLYIGGDSFFHSSVKPVVNIEIVYAGPEPEVPIMYSTTYGSSGTKIRKNQTIKSENVNIEYLNISIGRYPNKTELISQGGNLLNEVGSFGKDVTFRIKITGTSYEYTTTRL